MNDIIIEKLVVVGAAIMAHGIARVAATAGLSMPMIDIVEAALEKDVAALTSSVD